MSDVRQAAFALLDYWHAGIQAPHLKERLDALRAALDADAAAVADGDAELSMSQLSAGVIALCDGREPPTEWAHQPVWTHVRTLIQQRDEARARQAESGGNFNALSTVLDATKTQLVEARLARDRDHIAIGAALGAEHPGAGSFCGAIDALIAERDAAVKALANLRGAMARLSETPAGVGLEIDNATENADGYVWSGYCGGSLVYAATLEALLLALAAGPVHP